MGPITDNIGENIGEMEYFPSSTRRERDKARSEIYLAQRNRCKPYEFNGLKFYTFVLVDFDQNTQSYKKDTSRQGLAVFRGNKLVAFAFGEIGGKGLSMGVALLSGSKIKKALLLTREIKGKGCTQREKSEASSIRLETLKKVSWRLRQNRLVKYSCEDAKERAMLCGLIPEIIDLYE